MLNIHHTSKLPVAIIGAGPVGLAAAAHVLERGLTPLILESGAQVGTSIREWAHVRLFSPWSECLDAASVRLLAGHGWESPRSSDIPTGADLLENYLEPLAALPEIAPHIRFSTRVVAVGRENLDKVRTKGREDAPFVIHVERANALRHTYRTQAVIDASGTWKSPNPMGAGGIAAPGEEEASDRISYGIPNILGSDAGRYAGRRVIVIGSGHSAANALLDLARLKVEHPETEIVWAIRRASPERTYGGESEDALKARGALGERLHRLVDLGGLELVTSFQTVSVTRGNDDVVVSGLRGDVATDLFAHEVIACTGFRPDLSFLREVRLSLDSALECSKELAPLIDPNVHSCGTVRPHGERELRHDEPGFYVAGMKSYGRAPTFLLLTGYEQVRSIAASLAGDRVAAERVELCLPETGVCSTDAVAEEADDLLVGLQLAVAAEPAVPGGDGSPCGPTCG